MATDPETAAFFLEQLDGHPDCAGVTLRRMFGEYAVQRGGKTLGLICDDTLFVRQLPEVTAFLDTPVAGLPYPGAKPWWRIEADLWEDSDWLARLVCLLDLLIPAPKPKRPRKDGRASPRRKAPDTP